MKKKRHEGGQTYIREVLGEWQEGVDIIKIHCIYAQNCKTVKESNFFF